MVQSLERVQEHVERERQLGGLCAVPVFAFEIWWAVLLLTRGLRAPAAPDVPADVPDRVAAR
ncbi:hypothetical protein ACT17Q_14695 [Cellulomonas sp. CW35]|uniref:hypothetical protein n=1 Tax=Cellulomonas sp. CW35 TaxID=3458249 RepID=UPI004033E66C